jgi:uncharacterized protein YdgA (DUF945 family)
MRMDDLRYTVRASASGDYYDAALDASVGNFVMDKLTLTDLGYQVAVNHLHGRTLAEMTRKYRETTKSMAIKDPMAAAAVVGLLGEYGPALLEHSPELVIERIGFRMPEGEFGIKGSLKVLEITKEELEALQTPMQLLTKLQAAFDVWVSQGLLEKDWDAVTGAGAAADSEEVESVGEVPPAGSKVEMMRQQVAAMEQAGYVIRKGDRLESRIEFKDGALTANGKPLGGGM